MLTIIFRKRLFVHSSSSFCKLFSINKTLRQTQKSSNRIKFAIFFGKFTALYSYSMCYLNFLIELARKFKFYFIYCMFEELRRVFDINF